MYGATCWWQMKVLRRMIQWFIKGIWAYYGLLTCYDLDWGDLWPAVKSEMRTRPKEDGTMMQPQWLNIIDWFTTLATKQLLQSAAKLIRWMRVLTRGSIG